MPIPFRDAADVEDLGAAGFLKIEPVARGQGTADRGLGSGVSGAWPGAGGGTTDLRPPSADPSVTGYVGALFLINARGEPLEFAYNRVETPDTFLWRASDLRRHAERKLTASLLTICGRTPRVLFCCADEVGSELFGQDLQLAIPVARIGRPLRATAYSGAETEEVLEAPDPLDLFWFPAPPAPDTAERRLVERLVAHGLLLEPFERAAVGLREVYPEHGSV